MPCRQGRRGEEQKEEQGDETGDQQGEDQREGQRERGEYNEVHVGRNSILRCEREGEADDGVGNGVWVRYRKGEGE